MSRPFMLKRVALVSLAALIFSSAILCAQTTPAAPAHTGNREISGVVTGTRTGQPLEGATVTINSVLEGDRFSSETTTDANGRFTFSNLPDGRFNLRAAHRGYVSQSYDQHADNVSTAIVTGDGLVSTGLELLLPPEAVIFGVVSDDSGDPVPQARVSLYRLRNGTGTMMRANTTQADSMGNYEVAHLAPGTYYLCAIGAPWYGNRSRIVREGPDSPATNQPRSPLDVAYPATCYPSVTDPGSAEPIQVTGGDRVPANVIMHAVPSVHISIPLPGTGNNRGFNMPQLTTDVFGFQESLQTSFNYIRPNGGRDPSGAMTVEMGGIAPGQYSAEVRGQGDESGRSMNIDASSDRVNVDLNRANPMATVKGTVQLAGGGALPSNVSVMLVPRQGDRNAPARVDADGTFHIQELRPGDYDVMINVPGSPWTVTRLSAKGATVSGRELKAGSEPIELTASIAKVQATVNARVTRNGKPTAGVFVELVPTDASAGPMAFRSNQSDSDGTFSFRNVIPGNYTLVAIEEGWTLEWAKAEVMTRYLAKGVKVTVTRTAKQVDVSDPVEVQPK